MKLHTAGDARSLEKEVKYETDCFSSVSLVAGDPTGSRLKNQEYLSPDGGWFAMARILIPVSYYDTIFENCTMKKWHQ